MDTLYELMREFSKIEKSYTSTQMPITVDGSKITHVDMATYGETDEVGVMIHTEEEFDLTDEAFLIRCQRMLRERYDLHIIITPDFYKDGINYNWQILEYNPNADNDDYYGKNTTGQYGDNGEYDTYGKALEAALKRGWKITKGKCPDDGKQQ